MRIRRFLALALLAAGCGPASTGDAEKVEFAGTYVGTLTKSATCSDGSSRTVDNEKRVVLEADADGVLVDPGDCGKFHAAISGRAVQLPDRVSCPPMQQQDGTTITVTLTGGTLTRTDTGLDADLRLTNESTSAGGTVTCQATARGSLKKQ